MERSRPPMFANSFSGHGHSIPTLDRRQLRVELPACPSCQLPLRVDVRSADMLYARCQSCGYRRMVAKPAQRP